MHQNILTTRRRFLAGTAAAGAGLLLAGRISRAADEAAGPYRLPPLPYAYDALEPYIDARTMEIHYTKHHAAYVKKLNDALKGIDVGGKTVEQLIANLSELPETVRTAVRNNGGGHANHTLFWNIMSKSGGQPKAEFAAAIDAQLGGLEKFKAALTKAAMTRFGSGWGWLVYSPKSKMLTIESAPNQDSPLMSGSTPILGIDVWEHAYYLKYQNRRDEYVKAWMNVIDWDHASQRYADAVKGG